MPAVKELEEFVETPGDGGSPRVENEGVFEWYDWVVFTGLTALALFALGRFAVYWFSVSGWAEQPVTYLLVTAGVGLFLAFHQIGWLTLPFMRRPLPMELRSTPRVAVITTIVPAVEPIEMLRDSLSAMVAIDYPHDTWVLDEGDDEEVKALCEELGAWHFSRKHLPEFRTSSGRYEARTKHGNLNAWLSQVGFERYDVVTQFDPDHVPQRRYLREVLPYLEDRSVGYVQCPQVYYNQAANYVARGGAEETYGYYSWIEMTNHGMGHPQADFCHSTHRVSALEEIGGIGAHVGEDLYTTLCYRVAGWRGVYLPWKLAVGMTPVAGP